MKMWGERLLREESAGGNSHRSWWEWRGLVFPEVLLASHLVSALLFYLTPRSHNWNLDVGKRAVLKIGSVQLSSVQSSSGV